jgi:hypothetical protein
MPNCVLPRVRQGGLTVIAEVRAGHEEPLRNDLAAMRATPAPFFASMPTVHYAAFVILPQIGNLPARLALETNYDGEPAQHIADLVARGGAALDRVYEHCEGYDAARTPEQKRAFMEGHAVPTAAFYVALPGRSVCDIRNAIAVYDEARDFLEALRRTPGFSGMSKAEVWNALVDHFRGAQRRNCPMRSPMPQRRIRWLLFRNCLKLALPTLAVCVFLLPVLLPIIRIYEFCESRGDRDCPRDPPMNRERLNVGPQNHLCILSTARTSRFRGFTLRLSLFFTGVLARQIFIQGSLDTIKTIHFARWALIDQGKRLLFFSNYDGSWSSYLNEFEDPPLLNAIWSNTQNFPPTKWILGGGAHLAARFEDHDIREYIPAEVFYTAYGSYSVPNLLRYVNLRDALAR